MTQPDFVKGLPKVLQAMSSVVASMHDSNGNTAQTVCIRRISATIYSSKVLLDAAQASPTAPIVSAALLLPSTAPPSSREAAVSAYISTVINSKEKLPEARLHAWVPCVARFTAACVSTCLEALGPMIKRSAENALTNAQALFHVPMHDLSPVAESAVAMLLPLLRHSKPAVVQRASGALCQLAACVHDAKQLADMACAIVGVMNGASGSKPKSGKERAALAEVVGRLCPALWDRRGLHRIRDDFRVSALRVANTLAKCVAGEPVTEAQVAVLLAAEAWAAAGSWQRVYAAKESGDGEAAMQHANELVAVLSGVMGGKADAEVRTSACVVAGALAVDVGLTVALKPISALTTDVAVSGGTKAAMRGAGCAGLAAAAAADSADSATSDVLLQAAQKLLEPAAVAGTGRHAAYAAVAAWHLLRGSPDRSTVALLSRTLAAMALQNDSSARSAACVLLPKCIAAAPAAALALMHVLWDLLAAYPDIPGIEGPPVPAGEPPVRIGAKLVAHRAVAAVTIVAHAVPHQDARNIDLILRVLHHPVVAAADIHAAAQHSTSWASALLKSLGVTDAAVLSSVVLRAAGRLQLMEAEELDGVVPNGDDAHTGTPHAARSEHLAAQRSIAAVLAVDPDVVWPACFAALKGLLCADALAGLHANDIRTFRTPRGRLMVEEFQSQLSPDELFAQRSEPAKAARPTAPRTSTKPGSGGKKKSTLSKDEQQRLERLEAEVWSLPEKHHTSSTISMVVTAPSAATHSHRELVSCLQRRPPSPA